MTEWLFQAWVWSPVASALVAAIALVMTVVNLTVYRRGGGDRLVGTNGAVSGVAGGAVDGAAAVSAGGPRAHAVSVCIPARNEEANIEAVVRSALASTHGALEVLVYDDESTDRTSQLVRQLAAADSRVRIVPTQRLPEGWNGKQWACQRMAEAAEGEWLLFTDADVRMQPACIELAVARAQQLNAALLSTVPRQVTGTLPERLVVPMIHWMLLSWLPMPRMRRTNDPATSAGCGQFLLVRRDAWRRAGGHAAFRASMHDGIKLPRAVRRAGLHTDLFDGTDLVSCRMYTGAAQVWRGFTKNAYEGLGGPVVLGVFTVLEGLFVLPWLWLLWAWKITPGQLVPFSVIAGVAVLLQLMQRAILAWRFRQSWVAVALHPLSIIALLAIQWASWWKHTRGQRAWKGRGYGVAQSVAAGVDASA